MPTFQGSIKFVAHFSLILFLFKLGYCSLNTVHFSLPHYTFVSVLVLVELHHLPLKHKYPACPVTRLFLFQSDSTQLFLPNLLHRAPLSLLHVCGEFLRKKKEGRTDQSFYTLVCKINNRELFRSHSRLISGPNQCVIFADTYSKEIRVKYLD